MSDCIFCKIARREMPKTFDFETDNVMVFEDISPRAPIHLLVIPKRHILEFKTAIDSDKAMFDEIISVVAELIKKYKLDKKGYRVVMNGGGAQQIDHFHVHLMGEVAPTRTL